MSGPRGSIPPAGRARAALRRKAIAAILLLGTLPALASLAAPGSALAAANPTDTLTYMPTEMVHSSWTQPQVEGFISGLDEYDIGQALLQMPRFKAKGTLQLPAVETQMLGVWAAAAASYNATHGTGMTVTAVFNGQPKGKRLNLELPQTRANVLAAVESVLATGISGVQLDIEPYPTGPGFLALLEGLDAAFARLGFHGRLSVVAPAELSTWSPSYLRRVSELVDQVDPTFYDSEIESIPAYEEWVEQGLAYYSANASAHASIVPVIPSYAPDPWHDPKVEDIANATSALESALASGSRIEGAGIWWWYAFYEERSRHLKTGPDRAAWLARTVELPFSP
jgi:hypothetical protein